MWGRQGAHIASDMPSTYRKTVHASGCQLVLGQQFENAAAPAAVPPKSKAASAPASTAKYGMQPVKTVCRSASTQSKDSTAQQQHSRTCKSRVPSAGCPHLYDVGVSSSPTRAKLSAQVYVLGGQHRCLHLHGCITGLRLPTQMQQEWVTSVGVVDKFDLGVPLLHPCRPRGDTMSARQLDATQGCPADTGAKLCWHGNFSSAVRHCCIQHAVQCSLLVCYAYRVILAAYLLSWCTALLAQPHQQEIHQQHPINPPLSDSHYAPGRTDSPAPTGPSAVLPAPSR